MVGTFINISGTATSNGGSGTVTVSGTPSAGQVIEALTSTTASWQSPSSDITLAGDVSGVANANTVGAISGSSPIAISAASLSWGKGVSSPGLTQATATTDVATQSITLAPQAPYASASTNVSGGSVVVNLPAALGAANQTNENYLTIQRAGTNLFQIGCNISDGTGYAGIWGSNVTPSFSNHSFLTSSTNTYINAASTVNLTIATATILTVNATSITLGQPITLSSQTTATSASAGANGDVPAQVVGYLVVSINGTSRKIPYYAT